MEGKKETRRAQSAGSFVSVVSRGNPEPAESTAARRGRVEITESPGEGGCMPVGRLKAVFKCVAREIPDSRGYSASRDALPRFDRSESASPRKSIQGFCQRLSLFLVSFLPSAALVLSPRRRRRRRSKQAPAHDPKAAASPALQQPGHLPATAPTGNHVIESHSLCDCHFVDDRFRRTPTMLHLI